ELRGGHFVPIFALAFSPDGAFVASGAKDCTILLWDARRGGQPVRAFFGHYGYISSLAFSPDGRRLASGASEGTIRLWDVATASPVRTLRGHSSTVSALRFRADGQRLVSSAWNWRVKTWSASDDERPLTRPIYDWISAVAFHPDGRSFAVTE